MNLLLDTHLLIWSRRNSSRLSQLARTLIDEPGNHLYFSAASIWETAIKYALGRDADFTIPADMLRDALLDSGFQELHVTGQHAVAVGSLLRFHGDPFDRLLLAQANAEGLTLLTADKTLARYPGTRRV
jgi:PIN domain nuclease of toxin-antitoxin system